MSASSNLDYWQMIDAVRGWDYQLNSRLAGAQYFRLYRLIARYLQPGQTVLDWGCGCGHMTEFCLQFGFQTHAYAIHASPHMDKMQSRWGSQLKWQHCTDSPATLPYEDASFDAVFSIGVLEHVRESGGSEEASLREIVRTLKPGGLFVCFHLPNEWSWIEAVVRRVRPGQGYHQFRYKPAHIRQWAKQFECDLLKQKRYAILPRNRLPMFPALAESKAFVTVFNTMDRLGSRLLPWICQNHLFIMRKRGTPPNQT